MSALRDRGDFLAAILVNAWHTRDLLRALDFLANEKWQHEIVPAKIRFANEIANRGRAA